LYRNWLTKSSNVGTNKQRLPYSGSDSTRLPKAAPARPGPEPKPECSPDA